MPIRSADRLPVARLEFPFRAWRAYPQVMDAAHAHTDIEFNLALDGTLSYFFAGRFTHVQKGQLAIFWAGIPHRLIGLERPGDTEYLCMTLPLAWFLSWNIGAGGLAERLLSGVLVTQNSSSITTELFSRWALDFSSGHAVPPRITLLEVEAFLYRFALDLEPVRTTPSISTENIAAGEQVERIAEYAGLHFADPALSIDVIAAAVPLHPKYAMALFKERVGMSLWEYVTRLRVSHAQRLLLTTDWSVERIALESGFASSSRFFAAFRKQAAGITPRRWRADTTSSGRNDAVTVKDNESE